MTSFRRVDQLEWVKQSRARAGQRAAPGSRKLEGIEWERRVEEEVFQVLPPGALFLKGAWWHFRDSQGEGWCQTDLLFSRRAHLFVVECKLSYHSYARVQLRNLYLPIISHFYGQKAVGIIAAQNRPFDLLKIVEKFEAEGKGREIIC